MPIPQVQRVNPLDLQKNISIGVSLPFNGPGVFNKTYSTKDQIKSNLINLLLTSPGERVMNPLFGCGIKRFLFEPMTETGYDDLRENIINSIDIFVPEITVQDILIVSSGENTITITVKYVLKISQTPDQVTLQFR